MRPSRGGRLTIVSGGQAGVDRAALDAALRAGVPCGGWCPAGRKAEDGPIPDRYPLREMPSPSYLARTRKNVEDSDATLIVAFGTPTGGTARTVEFCQQLSRPHLVIDAAAVPVEIAAQVATDFVNAKGVHRLNVAGPRASGEPRAYDFAFRLVARILALTSDN